MILLLHWILISLAHVQVHHSMSSTLTTAGIPPPHVNGCLVLTVVGHAKSAASSLCTGGSASASYWITTMIYLLGCMALHYMLANLPVGDFVLSSLFVLCWRSSSFNLLTLVTYFNYVWNCVSHLLNSTYGIIKSSEPEDTYLCPSSYLCIMWTYVVVFFFSAVRAFCYMPLMADAPTACSSI
jgi:hypothetical protein